MARDTVTVEVHFIPPTHRVGISVLVCGPEQWSKIYGQFSELMENLGPQFPSTVVTSHEFGVDEEDRSDEDALFKLESELAKVMPLRNVGPTIRSLLKAGIVFRQAT